MVFFQCDSCGEALKKAKVESHRYQCRNSSVSCIDCNKTFPGSSYSQHSTCVSEAERYQGQLYKGVSNKQARKQEQQQGWLSNVRAALESASGVDAKMRDVLNRLVACDNIPRKKTKFENFCRNSLAVRDESIIQRIWNDYINVAAAPAPDANNNGAAEEKESAPAPSAAEVKAEEATVAESKKRPAEDEAEGSKDKKKKSKKEKEGKKAKEEEAAPAEASKGDEKKGKKSKKEDDGFKWGERIAKAVKKAKGEGVDQKKLQKKLLKKYVEETKGKTDESELRAKAEKAFSKALKAFVVQDGKIVSATAA